MLQSDGDSRVRMKFGVRKCSSLVRWTIFILVRNQNSFVRLTYADLNYCYVVRELKGCHVILHPLLIYFIAIVKHGIVYSLIASNNILLARM